MRKRDKGYKDYGFEKDEDKRLKAYCRNMGEEDCVTLLNCAISSDSTLYSEIYFSLVSGASYEDLCKIRQVPVSKNDFYGYRRECMYKFKNFLVMSGKWR